jgi:hypothetical protein
MYNGVPLQVQKNINILDFQSETQKIFTLLSKNTPVYNIISETL